MQEIRGLFIVMLRLLYSKGRSSNLPFPLRPAPYPEEKMGLEETLGLLALKMEVAGGTR